MSARRLLAAGEEGGIITAAQREAIGGADPCDEPAGEVTIAA